MVFYRNKKNVKYKKSNIIISVRFICSVPRSGSHHTVRLEHMYGMSDIELKWFSTYLSGMTESVNFAGAKYDCCSSGIRAWSTLIIRLPIGDIIRIFLILFHLC